MSARKILAIHVPAQAQLKKNLFFSRGKLPPPPGNCCSRPWCLPIFARLNALATEFSIVLSLTVSTICWLVYELGSYFSSDEIELSRRYSSSRTPATLFLRSFQYHYWKRIFVASHLYWGCVASDRRPLHPCHAIVSPGIIKTTTYFCLMTLLC